MKIQAQQKGAVTIVRPEGPLLEIDAEQVKKALLDTSAETLGRVVLDMEAIPFVDSRGLEVLVEVTEEMSESGQALKLCAANKTVREVLELTALAPLFEHFEDVSSAARSFL
jgi:anti-sigma B factor antagonist